MSLHVPGFRQVGSIEKTAGRRATSDERDLVEGRVSEVRRVSEVIQVSKVTQVTV